MTEGCALCAYGDMFHVCEADPQRQELIDRFEKRLNDDGIISVEAVNVIAGIFGSTLENSEVRIMMSFAGFHEDSNDIAGFHMSMSIEDAAAAFQNLGDALLELHAISKKVKE